jgi:hypothetical protein
MKIQLVTPYHVTRLQRYSVTVRGNVTSVYLPLTVSPLSTLYRALCIVCVMSVLKKMVRPEFERKL